MLLRWAYQPVGCTSLGTVPYTYSKYSITQKSYEINFGLTGWSNKNFNFEYPLKSIIKR